MLATSKNTKQTPISIALAVSQGCIETLEQGQECLDSLNDVQYLWSAPPHVTSTIGEHFRHLLDLFHAVYNATKVKEDAEYLKIIDYNHRRRGHTVETSRQQALSEIEDFIDWLEGITEEELQAPVSVLTEVSVTHKQSHKMMSLVTSYP